MSPARVYPRKCYLVYIMVQIISPRSLFQLNEDEIYLNCARMGPFLKSSMDIGHQEIKRRANPSNISSDEFFSITNTTRSLFSELINGHDPERIVIAPSTSYIISAVARVCDIRAKSKILITEAQFPSNYYPWRRVATEKGAELVIVGRKAQQNYTETFLDAIDENTSVVAIEPLNWGDGLKVDIDLIGQKAREVGALYLIDGTQYVGAYPYDQMITQPDVLVTSAYKWLLAPYGLSLAYIGEKFDGKKPIEDSWLNRMNSQYFQRLNDYNDTYRPKARRFEVGQSPDFIRIPILNDALRQILKWNPQNIQEQIASLIEQPNHQLRELGCIIEEPENRFSHLYGIGLPDHVSIDQVKSHLATNKISVSYRGDVIRVSPHLYNTADEMSSLVDSMNTLIN